MVEKAKSLLRELDAGGLSVQDARGEDYERCHVEDDEGVEEESADRDKALLDRVVNPRDGVRVRGRAHSGLIGEESSCDAVAHRLLNRRADDAARSRGGVERADEDALYSGNELVKVDEDDDEASDNVDKRHYGHDLLGGRRDAPDAADEHKCRDGGNDYSGDNGRNVKGLGEGARDGVRLHHVADEAERDDHRAGEEYCERLAMEAVRYVIGRASGDVAGVVLRLEELREHRLGEDGGHAEEGGNPHPENRARAAHGNRCRGSRDVAGSDLRGDRGSERLERGHAALSCPLAVEARAREGELDRCDELPDLDEAEAQREVDADADKERNKAADAPKIAVYELHERGKFIVHREPLT